MSLSIVRIGTAVPETVMDQEAALRIAQSLACATVEQNTWLPGMYAGTGIERRHISFQPEEVSDVIAGTHSSGSPFLPTGDPDDRGPTTRERMERYAERAPVLAVAACRRALREDLDPTDFTHLVTVSCTGFIAPGIDRVLVEEIGLRRTIERVHVGYMGCHGAVNGLRVARAFTRGDPSARVLLCAVELCSLHYHYSWNPGKMIANALFADGAAALVGLPDTGGERWRVRATGSCYLPDSADSMTWTIGDHGFEMTLDKTVPGLIARHLRPWLEGWLREQGMRLEDVASWAIHPGGPRILSSVEETLALPRDALAASRGVFAEYGNMSSPTLLFILDRLMGMNAPRPCVGLGFGPGMVVEGVLFA